MCNLSEGVFEQGVQKGWLIGMRRSVCAIMDSLQIPADEAMGVLKISKEYRSALAESMEKNA